MHNMWLEVKHTQNCELNRETNTTDEDQWEISIYYRWTSTPAIVCNRNSHSTGNSALRVLQLKKGIMSVYIINTIYATSANGMLLAMLLKILILPCAKWGLEFRQETVTAWNSVRCPKIPLTRPETAAFCRLSLSPNSLISGNWLKNLMPVNSYAKQPYHPAALNISTSGLHAVKVLKQMVAKGRPSITSWSYSVITSLSLAIHLFWDSPEHKSHRHNAQKSSSQHKH